MCGSTMNPAARRVIWAVQARYTGNTTQAVADLKEALFEAKEAHAAWEAEHGADPDWPSWYAKYLLGLDTTPDGHVPANVAGYGVAS